MAVEVRPKVATAFLRAFAPAGPWKLSAIYPGNPKVPTKTFGPETEGSLADWIERHNKVGAGIYFEPGRSDPARANARSKTADMLGSRSVSLDIDCGADRVAEVTKALLEQKFKAVPVPNLIVESGNGVQSHWILAEDADPEEVRAIIKGLIAVFLPLGADKSCHNPDRLLRLPGTTNAKPGKTPRLARWLPTPRTEPYKIKEFSSFAGASGLGEPKAFAEKATGAFGSPLGVVPVADLSELGLEEGDPLAASIVSGYSKAQVQAGLTDGEPEKGERSEVLHWVACELIRRGVEPGKVAGALMNPVWAISDSVLEDKDPTEYAIRQVRRAIEKIEEAAQEMLRSNTPPPDYRTAREWLNARFATVDNYGSRYRVMARPGVDDPTLPAFIEDAQWAKRFDGYLSEIPDPEGGPAKLVPLAKRWLKDRARASYSRVIFDPASEDPDPRAYNLWTGFRTPNPPTNCDLYLDLTREVIAAGDEAVAEYLLDWMALRVQQPGLKMEVAIALRGGQGLGKSLWVELFGDLFGPHFVGVSGSEGLTSKFNKHLQQALLVFGDEMNAAGDKATVARLKTLVTQTHIQIEPKGVDSFTAPNRFALIVASNDDRVVQIDPDDRRWLALDVDPGWRGKLDRFEALVASWRAGGREAFLDFLMARDLDNFNHRRRPITATHTEQVRRSFSGAMGVVHAMLDRGDAYLYLGAVEDAERALVALAASESPARRRQTPNGRSEYLGDLRLTSAGLRQFSGREEELAEAAAVRLEAVTRRLDATRASLQETADTLEKAVDFALTDDNPATRALAPEVRSYVKGLPAKERFGFLQGAIKDGDHATVAAVLGGQPFLSGLKTEEWAQVRIAAARTFAAKAVAEREAVGKLLDAIDGAGGAVIARFQKVQAGKDTPRAKANRELAALKGGK